MLINHAMGMAPFSRPWHDSPAQLAVREKPGVQGIHLILNARELATYVKELALGG
jgi:hypothetical protein